MLKEEFQKRVSFKVTDRIYEMANKLYMRDFTNNVEFCVDLDALVCNIVKEREADLQATVEDHLLDLLDTDCDEEINNFLYALLGVNTVIYLKAKNHIRLNAYEITIIEDELHVLVYETEKKRESKAV